MEKLLTIQEVANYLKVSRSTVWRWCNQGKLLAYKAGRGWRVRQSDLEKMLGLKIEWAEDEHSKAISVSDNP